MLSTTTEKNLDISASRPSAPSESSPTAIRIQAVVSYAVIAVAVVLYLVAYFNYPMVPTRAAMDSGWWNWTDQSRYYREALAWAAGDLRPSEHWYLPLYSLLGAVFVPFSRTEPFLIPDTICLALSGYLMTRLAVRLAPDLPFARPLGAVAFFATNMSFNVFDNPPAWGLKSWLEPWTTTPTAPLLLGLLLAAIRLFDRPSVNRAAVCGTLWGLLLMTRPTEATWSSIPAILFCAVTVFRSAQPVAAKVRIAAAGVGAAVIVAAVTVVLHYVVYGWSWGSYFEESLSTGFELKLLPIRWVWLVLGARPSHERILGLGIVFFWVLPGFAGILASILADRGRRSYHLLVGGAVMIHWAIYLCYRDLHPEGLWRFGNYHYFKWTQSVLFFYGILLVFRLLQRRARISALCGVVVVLFACSWRVAYVAVPASQNSVSISGAHELFVRNGLTEPDQAILVAAHGDDNAIYTGPDRLEQAGRVWSYNSSVKAWPMPGGLAFVPLRSIPAGPGRIELDPEVTIAPDAHPQLVRMHLVFGLPCAIQPHRAVCRPHL